MCRYTPSGTPGRGAACRAGNGVPLDRLRRPDRKRRVRRDKVTADVGRVVDDRSRGIRHGIFSLYPTRPPGQWPRRGHGRVNLMHADASRHTLGESGPPGNDREHSGRDRDPGSPRRRSRAAWRCCPKPTGGGCARRPPSVYNPDARARRQMVKAVVRERKSEAARRDNRVRAETGIRALRRQSVFTTPNVFPPRQTEPQRDPDPAELLHLQGGLLGRPSFLRSAVPGVRRSQLRQAHGAGRSAGARGAADRRARQDRLPGGAQAAACRRASCRDHAVPSRLGRPVRRRAGLRRRGAIDWRSSASTCVTRPASRRSARTWSPRAAGWTSSSTTRARPCGGRPSSTRT